MATPRQGSGAAKAPEERVIARNRRATYDYELGDRYEAGLVLEGSEVKALRGGSVEIVDAYAAVEGNEVYLLQLYIPPYERSTSYTPDARRKRKLLLHRREIQKLASVLRDKGLTLVPLRVYFKGRHAKVELVLAKGRSKGDRRQAIAHKEAARETRAALGRSRKGY